MKALITLTLSVCLTAFASGSFSTGAAELLRFSGYGLFRGDSYGNDALPMDRNMSSCFTVNWMPKLNQHVSGVMNLDLSSTGSSSISLADLALSLCLSDNFTVTGGQMKVPFGYAWTRSGGSMYFADRAYTNGASHFMNHAVRDNGVLLKADFDVVMVDIGIFNGTGNNTPANRDVSSRIAARATAAPSEWLEMGVSYSSIGQPELEEEGVTTDSWSSAGIDAFAVARYPLGYSSRLLFEGEYAMLGYAGAVPEGNEKTSGTCMSVAIGAEFTLGEGFVRAMRPMVRYDLISPATSLPVGADTPEDDSAAMDFCLALDITSGKNVLMLGGRSISFQNEDSDGYTNMYLGWRMNF